MDIDAWLSRYGDPVAAGELVSPAATALVSFINKYAQHLAAFVEARRSNECDLVVIDFRTGRPQDSAYPIKRTERIAIRFTHTGNMPLVYMLREDFPDTPHQQLAIEGAPRAICIDDRLWSEARLTWTPAELVHRIHTWFARAVRGELHDAHQPIDPILIGSFLSFIIPRSLLDDAADRDLIAIHEENRQIVRVRAAGPIRAKPDDLEPVCVVAYRITPEQMRRMTFAPGNLASLAEMLESRGVDLIADLRQRFSKWLGKEAAWRLGSRLVVIVEMPIIAPGGSQPGSTDLRAFITDQAAGDVAVAIGAAMKSESRDEGSKVGYVPPVVAGTVDVEGLRRVIAQSAEVHYEFDRELATRLSGRSAVDERKMVMIGAGSIGSHVADCLIREGRSRWTIIDDDLLLPHNLAKHTGRSPDVARSKASILADALSRTIDSPTPIAKAVIANVMTDGDERAEIDQALREADLVLDATASVLAARYLSDHPSTVRRSSVFFNPSGDAVVLLLEPTDRSMTLRDLEAQYLAAVAREESLAGHLTVPSGTYAYTGACRAITNLTPESRILTLSGLVSGGLGKAMDQVAGVIRVWSIRDMGGVDLFDAAPSPVRAFRAGEWTVSINQDLLDRIVAIRQERLPAETGGVLTGVVDIPHKSIHVVDAAPAPPDSKGTRSGFTRGRAGVQEHLEGVFERTRGQVRYVGEWHSHPPRSATLPSATDLVQIDWLATLFDMDTLPALMLIAGDRDISVIFANRTAEPVGDAVVPEARETPEGQP